MKFKLFAIISAISLNANAGELKAFIGVDLFQNISKQGRFEYDNLDAFKDPSKNITRVSTGLTYQPFNETYLWLTYRTNRLANGYMERTAFDTVANQQVQVLSKLVADSFIITTAFHKKFLPYVMITKAEASTKVIYKSGYTAKVDNTTFLYGLGFAIPFKEKHSVSISYFLPNKDFDNNGSVGLSYTYYLQH
jgi:hypothetical protein